MASAISKWTYIDAWRRSAATLGVEIEKPQGVRVAPEVTLQADMLVRDFGGPKGTLVFENTDRYPDYSEELLKEGFAASSLGTYADGSECSLLYMIEVLSDWGWAGEGPEPPWLIMLDGLGWTKPDDFYSALLPRLRAPAWHGHNLDALWDSIVSGDINGLNPPFAVCLYNTSNFSPELSGLIERVAKLFEDAQHADVPVFIWVWP
jgi:RNAse (barnase) inhibitor barstar